MKKNIGKILGTGLLVVLLFSGCEQVDQEPLPQEEPVEPAYSLSTPVELTGLRLDGRGLLIRTDNAEYGNQLFPVELLDLLDHGHQPEEIRETPEGLVRFVWKGHPVELEPGTGWYALDEELREAPGPSFWTGGQLVLHGELLAALDEHLDWVDGGLLLRTPVPPQARPQEITALAFWEQPGIQMLINRDHPIPAELDGIELINLNRTYPDMRYLRESMLLNEEAATDLAAMVREAENSPGVDRMLLVSTYRSYNYQREVLNRRIARFMNEQGYDRERATAEARRIVAVPGTSEHQSGLAVDFTSYELTGRGQTLTGAFYDTPEGAWLLENSWRYGYILRYPADTEEITGIVEEAWHYRYVGRPHAGIITRESLVLETYMAKLQEQQVLWTEEDDGSRYLVMYLDEELASKTMLDPERVGVSDSNEGGLILTMVWADGRES